MAKRVYGMCLVGHGEFPRGSRCMPCKEINHQKWTIERRKRRQSIENHFRETGYKCCVEGCETLVVSERSKCRACKRNQTQAQASRQDAERMRRFAVARRQYSDGSWLEISPDELTKLDKRCHGCNKPIMSSPPMPASRDRPVTLGKIMRQFCYSCATGKQRTILRREERAESVSAVA